MKRAMMVVAACAAAVLVGPPKAQTAPKPSFIPVSWEIEFDNLAPRAIMVREGTEAKPKLFWYVKYTVTNRNRDKAGKPVDVEFRPDFVLYTDTGDLIRSQTSILGPVYDAIVKAENDPLMVSPRGVDGKLLFGADNAKTSVAIWPDFDAKAGRIDIFVGGLSGESKTVQLASPVTEVEPGYGPDAKPRTVKRTKVVLAKTLQLTYSVPGEAPARKNIEPQLVEKAWVMR